MGKQKAEPVEIININGKDATTVMGAKKLLNQRAKKELRQERDYSRDAVYAMFRSGKIEGIQTPSANYYYLDSLQNVPLDTRNIKKPGHYTHRVGKEGYSQEIRENALRMVQDGKQSKRAVAQQFNISYQTLNNWLKDATNF